MKKIIYCLILVIILAMVSSCASLGMSGGEAVKEDVASKKTASGTLFTYQDANASSVNIAGDFNGWDTQADPLTKTGDTWQISMELAPGTYMYKFVVNGSDWKTDPNNPNEADDGFGGANSVVTIGDTPGKSAPAQGVYTVNFQYFTEAEAGQVFLVGDFNDWSTTANEMKWNGKNYELDLDLKEGKYLYKFVNNGNWITDENASETVDDGYGGMNSVVIVGSDNGSKKVKKTESAEIKQTDDFSGNIPVDFTYQPLTGGKKKVFLAGDFNNWSPTATPMEENDGIYETTLNLRVGKYAYKFVVDGTWIADENAEEFVGDGFGGQNSIVFAGNKAEIDALRKVTFSYQPAGAVTDVYLAGSLNDWNQKSDMMTDDDGDGVYEVTKLLKSGEYSYKFVVNGMQWVPDEKAEKFEEDGFGGQNSMIVVDDSYPAVLLEKGDGEFLQYGLPFGQSIQTVNPLNPHRIEFKTRVHKNDLDEVYLLIDDEKYDLQKITEDNSFCYYQYSYEMPENQTEFKYAFVYNDGDNTWYMTNSGFSSQPYNFAYSAELIEPFYTPDWVKDGIVYQIFPERFANGDKANDPDFSEWYYDGVKTPPAPGTLLPKYKPYYHLIEDWYDISGLTKSPYHQPDNDGYQPEYNSFYGGDIAGIHQKLDYLVDLGITIIYFNPLFKAKSNHKYDAADYMMLDPHFGTNDEFKEFVDDCHAKGIRVIIDCAFNHTGETYAPFRDAAVNCENSEYWTWYEWKKCPLPTSGNYTPSDYYECWWGFGEMPNLNYDLALANPEENSIKDISLAHPNMPVVNHILDVADFWIGEMDLDGFRLDVPNEVPFWFWKLFREKVKSIKPDAWIVGEIWSNAVDWVNNDYFDSVMNYAYFKDPVQRFFNMRQCTAKTFDRDLKPGRLTYPTQAAQTMMNLIDSHDTFRYLETAKGDISALQLAALFQMTYVGAPHIWYGDEVAMMGKHDPDCRRPFNWKYRSDLRAVNLLKYYQNLIQIRKDNIALRRGSFQTLLADGMIYAYQREFMDNKLFVVINNDSSEKVIELPVDTNMRSLINQIDGVNYQVNNGVITINAAPYTGYILK
ncbi:MAG: alpha amylase N-terminal ig-like domain-containing protein [Candidatus Cloacimonetes bacterium]|nr:alpha amylase N-terminal ig-like domain-containing protein [Candidatus Cloacimonadota bacterium]